MPIPVGFASVGVAWKFIRKNKKAFLVSLVLIGCASFIASWLMRGAKIDRLKEEKQTVQLKLDNLETKYKDDLEACGGKIVEIQDKAEAAKLKSEAKVVRMEADLEAITEEADRANRESRATRREVREALAQTATAEEEIEVFLRAINERTDAS